MYLSSNTKSYVDTSTPADQPVKRSITGATILGKKSGEYSGQYNADITIDIVQSPTEGDVERPNIKKLKNGVENNVVELALVGDMSDTIKKIKDIKQENVKIHFSTVRFDGQFDVGDEEINDYINQQLDIYKQFYFGDDLDSALEAKR